MGYGALGQTWATPQVVRIKGNTNPVLVFGAGYDANAEDTLPATRGIRPVAGFS